MKLIKPNEISARIFTLLDESNERVIIVSPYVKISKWYKLMNKIKALKARMIAMEIYVRDDPENTATYLDLEQLELEYKKIPYLHSKLYMNEKYGIVTSMNLLLSSEINSLEIGYSTENWTEYNELLDFYYRYILLGEQVHYASIGDRPAASLKEITQRIREELNSRAKNSWLWFNDNVLHISTGRNNYSVSINDTFLRIATCLKIEAATKEESIQHSILIAKKVKDLTAMRVKIQHGNKPGIIQVSMQGQHILKSASISGMLEAEATYIVESVTGFIDATEELAF